MNDSNHLIDSNALPFEWIQQAKRLCAGGAFHEAVDLMRQACRRFPKNASVFANLGMVCLRSGKRDDALEAFRQAISLSNSPPAWFHRGLSALSQEIVELNGVKLHVPPGRVSPNVLRYLVEGGYESKEVNVLGQMLHEDADERILELGAGLGYLACYAGIIAPRVPYLTIEANPAMLPVIQKNLALNNCHAELIHGVASDRPGIVAFNAAVDFWASSVCSLQQDYDVVEVPAIDTNELIETFSPTMMIIDIEGGELELLPRLELARVKRILIELHPDVYGHSGSTRAVQALLDAGFQLDAKLSGSQVFLFIRDFDEE